MNKRMAGEIAYSRLHGRKQHHTVNRVRHSVFRRNLLMLEGGSQELKHIQGACEAPSPEGRLGSGVSTRNEGEECRTVCLQTGRGYRLYWPCAVWYAS